MKIRHAKSGLYWLLLWFLCIFLKPVGAQPLAARQGIFQTEIAPLETFLRDLEHEYSVRFNYASKIVENKFVKGKPLRATGKNLDERLELALTPLGLIHEKFNEDTYGIFAQNHQKTLSEIAVVPGPSLVHRALTDTSAFSGNAGRKAASLSRGSAHKTTWQIEGRVAAAKDGSPIAGVTVRVQGTRQGVLTDGAGRYKLQMPAGSQFLTFSHIGFETSEVTATPFSRLTVLLADRQQTLDEVVVVGYGTQSKSDLTGAVESMHADEIARTAAIDPAGALQGRISGINVRKNTNKPGSGFQVDIRGLNSINFGNAPLLVVDGIPVSGSFSGMGGVDNQICSLQDINPLDIEKIDVLKDASATAIYGSRGANGVIIVTTKRGKVGKVQVAYDGYAGIRSPGNLPDMMTGPEYVAYRTAAFINQGERTDRQYTAFFDAGEWANIDADNYTDWVDLIRQNGLQTQHTLSLTGGNTNSQYAISGGYLSEVGNVLTEKFDKYNLRMSNDFQKGDWLAAGISGYFSHSIQQQGGREGFRTAYRLRPTGDAYNPDGTLKFWPTTNESQSPNPVTDLQNTSTEYRRMRFFGGAYVEITPISGWKFRSSFSPDLETERSGYWVGQFTKSNVGTKPADAEYTSYDRLNFVLDNVLSFDRTWEKHDVHLTLAQSFQRERMESVRVGVEGLPYNSSFYNIGTAAHINQIESSLTPWSLLSYMGRINYGLNGRYLLTLTGRWDGSSKLATGNKWAFFPSAALAWRISDEPFLRDRSLVNNLKLRMSYGLTGNDLAFPFASLAQVARSSYDFGGRAGIGYAPASLGNDELTWEKTAEYNLGLDFGLFNNRISGVVEWYRRTTRDLIMNRLLPAHTGWESVYENVGSTRNQGLELQLTLALVAKKAVSWDVSFNLTRNRNQILELYGDTKDDVGNAWFIGQPILANYDFDVIGVWQLPEAEQADSYGMEPGQWKVEDVNGDGAYTDADRQIIGSPLPDWIGGLQTSLKVRAFDFSASLYTRQGEQVRSDFHKHFYNWDNGRYKQVQVPYWTESNPTNEFPKPGDVGRFASSAIYADVSFVRISNLTLGYSLPDPILSRLRMSRFRLYATALNPLLFTQYPGWDPEWGGASTFGNSVSSSTWLMGVNMTL